MFHGEHSSEQNVIARRNMNFAYHDAYASIHTFAGSDTL